MRATINGSLLIEINRYADSAEIVSSERERSMGTGTVIRTIQKSSLIELRDLDGMTITKEETEAVVLKFNFVAAHIKVLNIRKMYGGS